MKKRTLASILSLLLLFSIVSTASAASVNGFTDVSDTAWYADAVEYVTDNKLFQGKTETTFGPGDPMTRGMFVTVLGRYAEVDTERWIEGEIIRTDVNVRARDVYKRQGCDGLIDLRLLLVGFNNLPKALARHPLPADIDK